MPGKDQAGGGAQAPDPRSPALRKIVELAREELRDRGVSEEQIEALLNRRYAEDPLWEPPER